jgi:hypothetical protein
MSITEHTLGPFRWITATGARLEVFRALGAHLREEITQVIDRGPDVQRLRRHTVGASTAALLERVTDATRASYPQAWAELQALAEGARIPLETLRLLSFRGDLGPLDSGGCSDLTWQRNRSFIAHNEDGSPELEDYFVLLTLAIEDDPVITTLWCPGFLPTNTFTISSNGLAWSIDGLNADAPGDRPGRHFTARGLQRQARTLDGALDYLGTHPSAGGFAYLIGDRSGRVATAEAAAGQYAHVLPDPMRPLRWHTNHGLFISGVGPSRRGNSEQRAKALAAIPVPDQEPDTDWFLRVMADTPLPGGVRRDGTNGDSSITVCTAVIDLLEWGITIRPRHGQDVTASLADLTRG